MPTPDQTPYSKPISFLLHNTTAGPPSQMAFKIRPEELTRAETSRVAVHQTLGGAFVDSFGAGLPTLQISGHTGWRGRTEKTTGPELFKALHQLIYTGWHQSRAQAVKDGLDPNDVKLIFSDLLDDFNWVCVPTSFTLKRNTANPLVSYYQINLTWIDDYISHKDPFKTGIKWLDDILKSMDASLDKLNLFVNGLVSDVDGFFAPIMDNIKVVMKVAYKLNTAVRTVISQGNRVIDSVTGNLITMATGLSYAAGNILSAIIATTNFPEQAKARLMSAQAAWMNLYCLLQNAIRRQTLLPNYSSIYGASLCSSTAGGRPVLVYQNANTFEQVLQINSAGSLTINSEATNAINQINSFDTVLNAPSISTLNTLSSTIVQGARGF